MNGKISETDDRYPRNTGTHGPRRLAHMRCGLADDLKLVDHRATYKFIANELLWFQAGHEPGDCLGRLHDVEEVEPLTA